MRWIIVLVAVAVLLRLIYVQHRNTVILAEQGRKVIEGEDE